jgi:hypothetical protein
MRMRRIAVCGLSCCTILLCFISWSPSIHLAVCLTTGPKPLPKPALHTVRSRASYFRCEYPVLSLRSSSSFLSLLHHLFVSSIPPRQFLHKMWPIQLAFRLLISCRIFLCCLTVSNTSPFLTRSVQLIFSIGRKLLNTKCVFWFSLTHLVWNISHSKNNSAIHYHIIPLSHYHKHTSVLILNTSYDYQILVKSECSGGVVEIYWYVNRLTVGLVGTRDRHTARQTDRHRQTHTHTKSHRHKQT